jgi:hypothetical protein
MPKQSSSHISEGISSRRVLRFGTVPELGSAGILALVNAELIGQTRQRHILPNGIMGNEQICPRLASVAYRVTRSVAAPLHSGVFLGQHLGIVHIIAGFGFDHIDAVRGFRHEIRLVFLMVGAQLVIYLELPSGRLEPFQGVAIQDDRRLPFGIGPRLLDGIETALKAAKKYLGDQASILHRLPEIVNRIAGSGREGALLQCREPLADNHVIPVGLSQ